MHRDDTAVVNIVEAQRVLRRHRRAEMHGQCLPPVVQSGAEILDRVDQFSGRLFEGAHRAQPFRDHRADLGVFDDVGKDGDVDGAAGDYGRRDFAADVVIVKGLFYSVRDHY